MKLTKDALQVALNGREISDPDYLMIKKYLKTFGLEETVANAKIAIRDASKEKTPETMQNFYEWSKAYFYIENAPFAPELLGWYFWVDIYKRGDEPKVIFRKASQIGASYYAFGRAIYHCCVYPDKFFKDNPDIEEGTETILSNVGYVFPKDHHMQKLVGQKFDPIVHESNHIRRKMTIDGSLEGKMEIDNTSMKKIGKNFINFCGSQNQVSIKSWTAGLVILDEFDEMDERVDELVVQRMNATKFGKELYLSNPELPDMGIDVMFKGGTQDYYYVKCPHCKKKSTPDFFTHHSSYILSQKKRITKKTRAKLEGEPKWVCPKCYGDFIPSAKGEWISKKKKAKYRSYHIPLILTPSYLAVKAWEKWEAALKDESKMEVFYKHQLGLPYVNSQNCLSISDIMRCKRDYKMAQNATSETLMGIDWGLREHYYVIAEKIDNMRHRVLSCGYVKSFEEAEEIANRFNVKSLACDLYGKSGGDVESVRKFIEKLLAKGIVAVACTHQNMKSYVGELNEKNDIPYDKSMCIDRLYGRIRGQDIELPSDIPNPFVEHHLTFIRRNKDASQNQGSGFQYVSKVGKKVPDHYQSAHYFLTIALDMHNQSSLLNPNPIFIIV